MTIGQVVRKVLLDEQADVIRKAVKSRRAGYRFWERSSAVGCLRECSRSTTGAL
jgi:hypothetical protein